MNRQKVLHQLGVIGRDLTVNSLLASKACPGRLRTTVLRALGFKGIDPTARMFPGTFLGSTQLTMGANSGMNYGCFLDLGAPVTIGKDCGFGYQVMLINATHEIGPAGDRTGADVAKPITIGDGVWLGARVIVLPGVTIGSGCIVATGSVVARDLEPNGFYAGNPVRRVRDLV